MGIYLNPGNVKFKESIERTIYVDKSLLIEKVWHHAKKLNKYICISRPRRFGKSTDADMLAAYFSKGCDSHALFDQLKIAACEGYEAHLNQHNVIHLNMQMFLSVSKNIDDMLSLIFEEVAEELKLCYNIIPPKDDLIFFINKIYARTNERFIFIIDEWDCIFREYKEDKDAQNTYLDFLRALLKDQAYVELTYLTGILPIKKYGTHSALNMFDEISMLDAKEYSEFMGFTETEVKALCMEYAVNYQTMKEWYDGYHMRNGISTYSPRSVTASINHHDFSNYWSQTETYEALKVYIDLNYDGLKDTIIDLLTGKEADIDTLAFQNDMSSFVTKDDVLTLLVHLGYLGYCYDTKKIYIPNNEIKDIFITSIKNSNWDNVTKIFQNSRALLEATWNMDAKKVACFLEYSHYETSILQYNDENALAYTISLAYIAAGDYYTMIRELPAGKGFADIAFLPKTDKPAMLIELKYDKNADAAIKQIKDKNYPKALEQYMDNLLLVGINYEKDTKKHTCLIEKYKS